MMTQTEAQTEAMPLDILLMRLTGITKNVLGLETMEHKVALETNFFELGIDSMNVIDLVLAIEHDLKIQFTEEELSADLFVRAENLIALIQQRSRQ